MWEDGCLAEKLEGVVLEENSVFGGLGWSRFVETANKEEGVWVMRPHHSR